MARTIAVTFTSASGRLVVTGARICFEPSAYDGSETAKRSLVLEVEDQINDTIKEWEQQVDPVKLSSAITSHGIRAKLDPTGVRCWQEKQLVPLPDNLKCATCNAVLEVYGIWSTKNQIGLNLQCNDIKIISTVAEYFF